ncbi:hypothetical protein HLB42_21575 (plasmid) [Deinococcus sp. D7000]|nr:hypothetical protein HLB42_13850 [Deinococcus sp. D7000]QLG13532.1 hypothetical protein HLB42_21575 [Deinococcus sp. D7000]
MQTTKPTAGQRSMERRMTAEEAARLAQQFKAMPYSSFYKSVSEFTGKERYIAHADALYVLTARGLLGSVAA